MTLRRLVVISVLALAAAACGDGDGPAAGGSPAVPAGNATEAALLPTDAAELPELDPAGFRTLLGQLRGTPVLVNFWGSWCAPCRDEAPDLADAHERFGDRVQFLGVDLLDARESARGFMRDYGWTYPSVFDPSGAIRDDLGLLGQPVTLFIDAAGELVDRWTGPIPPGELAARLERLAPAER
ncbi:MAG: TlpA family protein disulfide reductase [Actinomycetota bacterium]